MIPFKKTKVTEADSRNYKLKITETQDPASSKPTVNIDLVMRENENNKAMRDFLTFNGTPAELKKSIEFLQRIVKEALFDIDG